jgi:putative endonuclease
MNHFYFTYVLLSLKDGMFYTGYTRDITERIIQHHSGNVPSTTDRRPLRLLYYEACLTKEDALAREKYLKSGMGKRYIRNRLKTYLNKDV